MFGFEFLPQDREEDITTLRAMRNGAQNYLKQKVDFVLIPANVRKNAGVNAILSAYMLSLHFKDMLFVPTISAAGLDKIQILSQILSLKYANFTCVALIGGDDTNKVRNEKIDGIELIQMTRDALGSDISIISGTPTDINNPTTRERLVQKLYLGVDRIITQPIFCPNQAKEFIRSFTELKRQSKSSAKLSLGVFGIFSLQSVRAINEAHLGFEVPKSYIEQMQGEAGQEDCNTSLVAFKYLWENLQKVGQENDVCLYLSTPKHNDLRAYGVQVSEK